MTEAETNYTEDELDVVAPPKDAVSLPNERPRYQVQQVPKTYRWQVVRYGPKGGKKLVMSYQGTDIGRTAALSLSAYLKTWADDE